MEFVIGIEDSLWTDPRILKLAYKLKMRDWAAIGAMSQLWYYCKKTGTRTLSESEICFLIPKKGFIEAALESSVIEEIIPPPEFGPEDLIGFERIFDVFFYVGM